VLTNDFHEYKRENFNYNRLETLKVDGLWLQKHELLLKDNHMMNLLDYMFLIERQIAINNVNEEKKKGDQN